MTRASRTTRLGELVLPAPSLSLNFLRRMAVLVFLVALAVYVAAVNRTAVQGFSLRQAERAHAALSEENRRLKIEEAEWRSLANIESAKERLGLVETASITYLEESGPVALR